jgi:hypothetical protein
MITLQVGALEGVISPYGYHRSREVFLVSSKMLRGIMLDVVTVTPYGHDIERRCFMALTPAERQRVSRQRRKEKLKTAEDWANVDPIGQTFSQFLAADREREQALAFMGEALDSVGIDLPDLTKNEDPEYQDDWAKFGVTDRGALGRAERMYGAFLDCARTLARLLNEYKREGVEKSIATLKGSDLSDPAIRDATIAELIRLEKALALLEKEVRHSFNVTSIREGKPT